MQNEFFFIKLVQLLQSLVEGCGTIKYAHCHNRSGHAEPMGHGCGPLYDLSSLFSHTRQIFRAIYKELANRSGLRARWAHPIVLALN